MVYVTDSGQELHVHDHTSDRSCHWINVFKPLAFLVFWSPVLIQSLSESAHGKDIKLRDDIDMDEAEYVKWLCSEGEDGLLNLLNVLLHICEVRGVPKALL
jgi:hypothetical protein